MSNQVNPDSFSALAGWFKNAQGGYETRRLRCTDNGELLSTDAISISGHAQISMPISTVAAQSAALAGGIYDVWASADCYIKIAPAAGDVTPQNGYLLRAGNTVPVVVPDQEKIGVVLAAGVGTFYLHKAD